MEPVVTPDGYKVLQNPEESRSLLGDYYERQGFHIVHGPGEAAHSKDPSAAPAAANKGTFGAGKSGRD